ncbi:MAG: metallophosphoesterase [Clostridia bacterium]|nr:metallophosphoesterase [Clostridia bacterium]
MFGFIAFIRGFLSVILTVLNVFTGFIFGDFTADTKPLYDDCKLNFAVLSDIHMTEETARADMLRFGLQDMQEFSSPLDLVVASGDLTDHGEPEEWANLEKAFADYTPAKNIILAQGNHDTWTSDDNYALSRELFIEYNEKIAGREIDEVYYSTKVNGYTFIVLGSETDRTAAYISDTQIEWLEGDMEKAAKDGLPIFVVSHWPINESHGLPETWGDDEPEPDDGGLGDQSARVEEILKAYENVFMITGHIHSGFTKEGQEGVYGYLSVESDGSFHSINLPQYMYMTIRGRIANGTGFVFEVYEDTVEIRARSYSAGVWYTDYDYTIDLV